MRIGFAGSSIRIELTKKMVESYFVDIEAHYYVCSQIDTYETASNKLMDFKSKVDAMIFTAEYEFNQYNRIFFPDMPCIYIQKDWSSFQNALISLALLGIDFTNISIDRYSISMINYIVEDLNINIDNIHFLDRIIDRQHSEDEYSTYLFLEHKKLFDLGKVKACVTAMHLTYEKLTQNGIPCVYAKPTTDVIVRTINMAKKLYFDKINKIENIVMLIINISPKKEYSHFRKDEYLYLHEKIKVAEEIFYFARDTNAALVNESIDKYVVLMNRSDFIEYTSNLQNFYLVDSIFNNTNCDINIGIGYGFSPGEAKYNANLAVEKVDKNDKNTAYIVSNSLSSIGPISFLKTNKENKELSSEDAYFRNIALKSKLSISKVFELYSIMEKNKKNTFTSSELSDKMLISTRTTNRLLKKLELCNYARVVNTISTGDKGRPHNIYEINF